MSENFGRTIVLTSDAGTKGVADGLWRENQQLWTKTAYDLTERGQTLFAGPVIQDMPGAPYTAQLKATPQYQVTITGIAADPLAADTARGVEFTWRVSDVPAPVAGYVQSQGQGAANAAFYDDGWKIEDVHLHMGMFSRDVEHCSKSLNREAPK